MKTPLVCLLLLMGAVRASCILTPATGGQLTDYTDWFGQFAVSSDDSYYDSPHPPASPAPGVNPGSIWCGWTLNAGASALIFPQFEPPQPHECRSFRLEVVFLGESSKYLNDWGFSLDGVEYPLAGAIQTGAGQALAFGCYYAASPRVDESFDFWFRVRRDRPVNGEEDSAAGVDMWFLYDRARNGSTTALAQAFYGTVMPTRSVAEGFNLSPYTVVAFEEEPGGGDGDYNDLVFAYRWSLDSFDGAVPEPSAYGLCGGGVLILLGMRRWLHGRREFGFRRAGFRSNLRA